MKIKNEIKKIMLVLVLFIACMVFVQAGYYTSPISDNPQLNISFVNQEPDPVEPGKYVELRFRFENAGSGIAKDVAVELLPKYPFSFDSPADAKQSIGSLHGRQIGEEGVIVKFRVKVDKNAVEGENEIELRYNTNGIGWIKLDPTNIDIQSHDAILAVRSVESVPATVKPGEKVLLKIDMKNYASSLLKDIKLKLNLDSASFGIVGSSNEKVIQNLGIDESYPAEFELISKPGITADVHNIPLEIKYSDSLGKNYSKTNTISLVVGDVPELISVIDSSDIYLSGKTGNVVIRFVNKGLTKVKLLNVNLKPSNDYNILSSDYVYVGDIDSDDYETAEFKIYVKETKADSIKIPILIEYRDAGNEKYKEDRELQLKLYSANDIKKFGLQKGNSFIGAIIIIVILVAGFFVYMAIRKRKHKK